MEPTTNGKVLIVNSGRKPLSPSFYYLPRFALAGILLILVVISFILGLPAKDSLAQSYQTKPYVHQSALHFDDLLIRITEYQFKEEDKLEPTPSAFSLVNYAPMSNELGDRWALITVRNSSTGGRFLRNEFIVARFANGRRARARNLDDRVDGGNIYSKAVFFGHSDFPIISIEVNSSTEK